MYGNDTGVASSDLQNKRGSPRGNGGTSSTITVTLSDPSLGPLVTNGDEVSYFIDSESGSSSRQNSSSQAPSRAVSVVDSSLSTSTQTSVFSSQSSELTAADTGSSQFRAVDLTLYDSVTSFASHRNPYTQLPTSDVKLAKLPALSFPTKAEAAFWFRAMALYAGAIAGPAFISASFYASLTVDTEFAGESIVKTLLWYLVKAAMTVPVILGVNSAQILFSGLIARYQKDGLVGVTKEIVHPEMLLPLLVSIVSSLSTAYVAEYRNDGQFADSVVKWFTYAALTSATITNTRLIRDILIKNTKKMLVSDPQGLKKITTSLLDDLSKKVSELEAIINHKVNEKAISRHGSNQSLCTILLAKRDESLKQLIDLYRMARDETDIIILSTNFLRQWDKDYSENTGDLLTEKTYGQQMCSAVFFVLAVLAAAVYTAPNFFSGQKADEFSASKLPFTMPGIAIALASFSINTMINTFSLLVLFSAMADLMQKGRSALKNMNAWDGVQLFILSLYVFAQVGMVLVFPAEFSGIDPDIIQGLQLALTIFVAPGLGKFSLEGAFDRLRAYHDAYQSGSELVTGEASDLTALRAFNWSTTMRKSIGCKPALTQPEINATGGQGIPIHAMIAYVKGRIEQLKTAHNAMASEEFTHFYNQLVETLGPDLAATEGGRPSSNERVDLEESKRSISPNCSPFSTGTRDSVDYPSEQGNGIAALPSVGTNNFLSSFRRRAEEARRNEPSLGSKIVALCGINLYTRVNPNGD